MKILSYNIYKGGRTRSYDKTDEIFSVIRSTDADIVGLCECTGFRAGDRARMRHYERALGMRAVINRAQSGHHVAVLYREHVNVVDIDTGEAMMYHGFASITADLPGLGRTIVVMCHLHPRASIFRLAEAQNVLGKAVTEAHGLAMGDFNSPSDYDAVPDFDAMPIGRRVRLSDTDGSIAFSVPALFKSYGFADLGEADGAPTYPTAIHGKDQGRGPQLRIDYMFATLGLAAIARLTTVATPEAMTASDHLPLLCTLEI